MKALRFALLALGIVLFADGLFMSLVSNFNLGVILTLGLGVLLTSWGIFFKSLRKRRFTVILQGVFGVFLCAVFVLCVFLFAYGNTDNALGDEDAVIVLGAGIRGERITVPLAKRLDAAVKYHRINPDALIVVSGGQGPQEDITEALAMERYLVAKGVDPDAVIKEERATSTAENMRFSKELLDERFPEGYDAVIITNGFHVYRSVYIANLEGLGKLTHIHGELAFYNIPPCYLRECLAVLKTWILG